MNYNSTDLRAVFTALFYLACAFSASKTVSAQANKEAHSFKIQSYFDHFSYSGPISVFGLANDWKGKLRSGNDAILDQRFRFTTHYNKLEIGYSQLLYHQYEFPRDLARGFYLYNNDISLDSTFEINTYLKARSYSGKGLTSSYLFNYDFEHSKLSFRPRLNWHRLDYLIWGEFDGRLFYRDTKNWGGTINLDYQYSKDFILRRPLENDPKGNMYSVDLDLHYSWGNGNLEYQGRNLYALIDWPRAPHTFGEVTTEKALALFAREGYRDFSEAPPTIQLLSFDQKIFGSRFALLADIRSMAIRNFYRLGASFAHNDIIYIARQDIEFNSVEFGAKHQNVEIALQSQTWDISQSQQLNVTLSLSYAF